MAKVSFAGVINNLYIITVCYPNYGYGIDQAELYRYNNDRTLKSPRSGRRLCPGEHLPREIYDHFTWGRPGQKSPLPSP